MTNIQKELFKYQDKKYREFQAKLIPNIDDKSIIGVRTPILKKLAKELYKNNNYQDFLNSLPHQYFDEYQLHAFIISEIKDYDSCIRYLNNFLPYIDNWATCDQLSPKVFKKHKTELLKQIRVWIKSKDTYTIRFAIGLLMSHFLDDDYNDSYLNMVCKIKSDEYYINMMRAWYFATALAKQYDSTIVYLKDNKLDLWTHNKTIQKAIESNRIDNNIKDYLRKLKR